MTFGNETGDASSCIIEFPSKGWLFDAMAAVSPTASAGIVTQVVGCTLPQFGELAHADVAAFAAATEQLGVDSLWVADRLLAPVDPTALHAGMRGAIPEHYRTIADPLIALTVAATVTTTVRLGASVLVGPWYPPVQLARQLTTIDAVSDGRLLPGFGVGWSPDEYCASGARFEDRGALLDELLDVLIALWTTSPVEHQGVHWSIPPSWVDFKPVQRPRPPIDWAPSPVPACGGWVSVQTAGCQSCGPVITWICLRYTHNGTRSMLPPARLAATLLRSLHRFASTSRLALPLWRWLTPRVDWPTTVTRIRSWS